MSDIERAAQLLKDGRLVAFPTETVYGLGGDATETGPVYRIYLAKGRPSTNPLIIHVLNAEMAKRFVMRWPAEVSKLAEKFWPGPLTLVLPNSGIIPLTATAGLSTVALRVPQHPVALELLRVFNGPIAAPSANRSTRVSPTTAQHVRDEFPDSQAVGGHEWEEPAMILDGGACYVGIESTVLDLSTHQPVILRPGAITAADLEPMIGHVQMHTVSSDGSKPAASPGQQEIHYAPKTPAFRFETPQRGLVKPDNHGLVVVSPLFVFRQWESIIAMPNDAAEYARRLYAVLRDLDAMDLKAIFIEMPPEREEWGAIRDRIRRASRVFEEFGGGV